MAINRACSTSHNRLIEVTARSTIYSLIFLCLERVLMTSFAMCRHATWTGRNNSELLRSVSLRSSLYQSSSHTPTRSPLASSLNFPLSPLVSVAWISRISSLESEGQRPTGQASASPSKTAFLSHEGASSRPLALVSGMNYHY
jgi:hypothetical protein